nr:pyridoxamine 5'-phosphate oxidase family protein [Tissierella sp.]
MDKYNEKPEYVDVKKEDTEDKEYKEMMIEKINIMIRTQDFGVLATQGDDECYTSLISYSSGSRLKTMVFATPIKTKKYESIEKHKNVSILVDNRSNNSSNINDIAAITAIGSARILEDKDEIKVWSKILVDKHNYLDDFIDAESTAIVLVDIKNYSYVSSFQEVIEWKP